MEQALAGVHCCVLKALRVVRHLASRIACVNGIAVLSWLAICIWRNFRETLSPLNRSTTSGLGVNSVYADQGSLFAFALWTL